ncbi:MAG TPA: glycosyltransferase family 2 protein [Chitinophagales bacterium]|nr:glycosyltransferase family 2 protein [Chitinophagales bacterium]
MAETPELSVVILCYRAEGYIVDFVQQVERELQHTGITYELVLVANYDTNYDTTPAWAAQVASTHPHIKALTEPKQGKMGWDMRSGLREATGNYIAVIDGDGQMPVSDLLIVYHIIKKGQYDLVKTYRAVRNDGLVRMVLSKVYNLFFFLLFLPDFPVRDINSKPKILTRQAYQKLSLKSNDWFTDSEIMIQAFENKMRICEVSTMFYKNQLRHSFVGIRAIFEFIYNLFYYRIKR